MNLKHIKSSTYAMLVGGLFVLGVGTYTDNGGFQLAGGILLVVAIIVALNDAASRAGDG